MLALADLRIDDTTAESLFDMVAHNLTNCCSFKFALACSVDGMAFLYDRLIVVIDLEDPPSRQLSYSLAKMLFRVSAMIPVLENKAQQAFLDHLEKVRTSFTNSITNQGLFHKFLSNFEDVKELLCAIFCLLGSCEAVMATMSTSSSEFALRLKQTIQSLIDGELLIGIESLLSSLNTEVSMRKSSSGSIRSPHDTQLHYLLRIRARYILQGEPPSALVIQRQVMKLFEHVCYLSCPSGTETPGFLPLKGFKERFNTLGKSTLAAISEIAASQLESIEASADFLKFKTSPHQDLSLSLKATCIRLACIAFVTAHGSTTNLPNLVKNVLNDSTQMGHDELSNACLDAIAAISMNCHEHTADLNRSLRTFIINTHTQRTSSRVSVGAKRLAWCLEAISKDKVVSTLYSLVNVLASVSTSSADRSAVSLRPRTALSLMNFDHHTVASSISLTMKTDDQRQQVYSNVIEAIAEMVCELRDEKIAELMISLLGQKFGRVNDGVDKSLAWGLAKISTIVKERDFRRILKLHAKARTDPSTAGPAITETVHPRTIHI